MNWTLVAEARKRRRICLLLPPAALSVWARMSGILQATAVTVTITARCTAAAGTVVLLVRLHVVLMTEEDPHRHQTTDSRNGARIETEVACRQPQMATACLRLQLICHVDLICRQTAAHRHHLL